MASNNQVQKETPIKINVIESSQLPWNKQVPFKVIIRVNVPVKTLYVTANAYAGAFIPHEQVLTNLNPGTYSIKLYYKPQEQGTITYSVAVTAATQATNYADTYNGTMQFNSKLIRHPVTPGYLGYIIGAGLIVLVITIVFLLNIKKLLYYFKDKVVPDLIEKQAQKGI